MMIVVDANIIFSAIIKPSGAIGRIIFSNSNDVLIAPNYLRDEIYKHKLKLIKITSKTEEEIEFVIVSAFKKITFYSADIIANNLVETASDLVADIDPDDFIYVAFTLFFNAKLWSGDKVLSEGLKAKGLDLTITTPDVAIATMK